MRRIRLATGPGVLFGAMMLVALLLFLPMRLALAWSGLDESGFAARAVTGSVWDGRIAEAQFGDLAIGDLDARLSPFALLVGRARLSLDGTTRPLNGVVTVTRHGFAIDHVTASLPTGRIFQPLPVGGLDLTDVTVEFADGSCVRAEGRVRATLVGDASGVALPPSVAGNARCEGGALLLPLASDAGRETVALRITGGGRYTAVFTLQPSDPATLERLAASGFVERAGGYQLAIEGSF
ncbi:type II secretion system protein N [uncultured Sphingomonas sp.]|uniref:type II secretion system protein N n=1 Tax=uncultured Sphingomonas sp. TaxID=158754 RepID=UPI0035CC38E0